MARNTPAPEPEAKKEGQSLEKLEFFDSKENKKPADDRRRKEPGLAGGAPSRSQRQARTSPGTRARAAGARAVPGQGHSRAGSRSPRAGAGARAGPHSGKRTQGRHDAGACRRRGRTRPCGPSSRRRPSRPFPRARSHPGLLLPDRAQADRIRNRLTGGGQKAYLSPVDVAGRTMYRVRIGPFTSRADAQKVAEKVRKAYKLDTWVTE